ncbi:hypothetical protein PC121_g17038 [Phytophthora cactorum]|nr:hypothetical protein PC120_g25090 [Phytophthora cactorum]KAG3052982.1 hypothetical protein PC121_g17038 [Phytophthora cactorum]
MVGPQANLEKLEAGGQAQHGIELLSNTVEQVTSTVPTIDERPSADETPLARGEYEKATALPLADLQTCFREQINRRWSYVHTNAMGIAFMLDPAMDLNDFAGTDDDTLDGQDCKMARRCGILIPTAGIPKLTSEIFCI